MFANVNFMVSASDSALSVPNQAVGTYEQEAFIYKVTPVDSNPGNLNWDNGVKCIVKKLNVQLGVHNAEYSQIQYGALKAGDKVIISGNAQCSDGSMVIAKQSGIKN
jgi:multidrug efflux pump subunit AcrA (membrane-fusion protein)